MGGFYFFKTLAGLICLSSAVVAVAPMVNLYEGENCTLADGVTRGICRDHAACPYLKTIAQKDWVTCSFHRPAGAESEESPIVCCPERSGISVRRSDLQDPSSSDQNRECGEVSGLSDHIFGGSNALYSDFPYIAALGYDSEDRNLSSFRCGASLISSDFLLTAAHCLNPSNPKFARLGVANIIDGDASDQPVDIDIVEWIPHPNFKRIKKHSMVNDIALLRLERKVDEIFLKPACLYAESTDPTPDEVLKIAGWGTDDDIAVSDIILNKSPALQYANVTLVGHGECNLPFKRKPNEHQLCALGRDASGDTVSDSCRGDSGGPLELIIEQKRYIVGVVSYGVICGSNLYPGIYTRVSSYVDWISSIAWPS